MSERLDRRGFLAQSTAAALGLAAGASAAAPARNASAQSAGPKQWKKALTYTMLPADLSREDRFKLAADVGFDGVETPPVTDPAECEAMRSAADKADVRIHSVIFGGWDPPLTHPDPEAQARAVRSAQAALEGAHRMGADCILLVPGIVNAETRYQDAWKRSRENIKKLIPTAERLKVRINLEEVWNNFLLSPIEFVSFVDSFRSPWVQAYFDVGNVVPFGWPEDWIRTLGKRIRKVHLKDFKGGPGTFGAIKGEFVNLREGSVNWPEVMRALHEIGYNDWVTTELRRGDAAYLRDVAARVDKILAGE